MNPHVKRQIIITDGNGNAEKLIPVKDNDSKQNSNSATLLQTIIDGMKLQQLPKNSIVVGPTGYLDNFKNFQEGHGVDEHGRIFVNVVTENNINVRVWQRYTDSGPVIVGIQGNCRLLSLEDVPKIMERKSPITPRPY